MSVAQTQATPGGHPTFAMVLLLGAMTAFGAMSIDMYLPALPTIAASFGADEPAAARTVSVFFIGMALGQLAWGPIADRFGRRPPLLAGLAIYLAASVACALAPTIETLTAARLVQSIGACSGIVITRAVVRDRYDNNETARILSLLVLVMGLAPILAPFVGGVLLKVAGWRTIFWALTGFAALVAVAVWTGLPESRSAATAATARGESPLASYAALFGDRRLTGYLLTSSLNGACLYTYIVESPSLIITRYGIPAEHFGWVFGANAIGLVAMSQLNRALLVRNSSDRVLAWATPAVLAFAVLMLGCAITGFGDMWGVFVPLFLIVATFGLTGSNTMAGALSRDPERSGTVSALFGSLAMATGAVSSAFSGLLHNGTAVPMAAIMALCAAGATLSLYGLALRR